MIKSEERFFNYLNNKLSDFEKTELEKELNNNKAFYQEFQDYKKLAIKINDSSDVKLNDDYLNGVIPRFREKLHHKNNLILKPAIGFALGIVVMVLGYLTVIQLKSDNVEDLKFTERTYDATELDPYLDYFDLPGKSDLTDYQIPEIDSVYNKNLEQNIRNLLIEDGNKGYELIADLSYTEMEDILSDQQFEDLYLQLSETNFTRGAK